MVDSFEFKLEDATRVDSAVEANRYEWPDATFELREFFEGVKVTVELLTLSDTSLSALSVSPGTLSPAFTADTTSYTVSVAHSVETITVTAEAVETSATVTIEPEDEDGDTSGHQVGLDVGQNVITATVVDGTLTGSYTVTVEREELPAANFGAATYTATEGESVDVVVTLDPAPSAQTVIPITAANQGSTTDADYTGVPASLTFAVGDTSQTFTVMAVDDTEYDTDESVKLSFGTLPTGVGAGSLVETTVNLVDNDGLAVQFGAATYTATEGESVDVVVTLDPAPLAQTEIPITATNQGSTTDADYTGVPASLTFAAGDTSQTFTVTAVDDTEYDADGSVQLAFGTLPTGVEEGSPAGTTVSLVDNDGLSVQFGAATYTATEGASVDVVVALDPAPLAQTVIPITATNQGGATSSDYSGVPASLTFAAGDTSRTFTVTVVDDTENDDDESVKLSFGTLPTGVEEGSPVETTVSLVDNDDLVVTAKFGSATYTASEGGATATVTVELSIDPEQTVVIPITATDQGGATADDYSGVPANLTFAAGDTSKTFTVTAVNDGVDDDDESVQLSFGSLPAGVSEGSPVATTVSLVDDDYAETATLAFSSSSYTATEGGSPAVVTVSLSDDVSGQVYLRITDTPQGDTANSDYVGVPWSLVILNASNPELIFTVTARVDEEIESGESVQLEIEVLNGNATAGAPTTVHLRDDGSNVTVGFGSATYTAAEGESAVVAVSLSESLTVQAVVPITATNQDSTTDADYSGVPSSLTFAAGDTSKAFTVAATQDTENDDGESVELGFGMLPTGLLAGSQATSTVSITDDDHPEVTVKFGAASYTAAEGERVAVTVKLSADPERTVTIPLTPSNQDGATAADYSGVPASVTLTSGQTSASFRVTATDDTEDDDGESVVLGFGSALPDRMTAVAPDEATVSITDDDDPEVTVKFGAASYAVVEGGTATVTVTLSADPERDLTIGITTTDQDGATSPDYSGVAQSVTFASGETSKSFTVTATQDTEDDDGESVGLSFGSPLPDRVTVEAPSETVVAITDDDDPPPAEITTIRFRSPPSDKEYKLGDVIEVITRFDKAVEVTGTPRVKLLYQDQHGFGDFYAPYDADSSSDLVLVFKRTVTHVDDDESEVRIGANGLQRNGGRIRNKGTTVAADLSHTLVAPTNVLSIKTRSVADIAVTSTSDVLEPVSGDAVYGPGEKIEFTVAFESAVNVDTTPRPPKLIFQSGPESYTATYESGGGTENLVFGWIVPATLPRDGVALEILTNVDANRHTVFNDRGLVRNRSSITNAADLELNLRHEEYTLDVQVDVTAPSLQGATVEGTSLVLTYDEDLDGNSAPAASAFTVKVDGSSRSVSTVAVSGKTVTLTLSSEVLDTETVTVSYEAPSTTPLKDAVGNEVAGLSDEAVSNDTVTVDVTVAFDASSYTAVEGGTAATVTVELSADPERTVVIPITAIPQSPATAADYSGVPASVTLTSGQQSATFTVTATDDQENDDGESLVLDFGSLPEKVTAPGTTSATVSLEDNDDPQVTVMFGETAYTVAEGDEVEVTVSLSADPERTVTIQMVNTNQDGASVADYSGVPASLTFAATETSKSFTVMVTDDSVDDDDESVKLTFGTLPTGVSAGTRDEVVLSITDDDDPAVTVQFGSATYAAVEGSSVAVMVTLSADPERDLTITLTKTNQGSATDADYSGVLSSVTLTSGQTSATFTVTAAQDTVNDDGESVKLGFSSTLPTGVSAGSPAETVVSLTDDDNPAVTVQFGAATYEAMEGGTAAVVTVDLSVDPERDLTITLARANQGTATDADYSGVPASLTFAATETSKSFTVTATDDSVDDNNESVKLTFDALPAGVTAGTRDETVVSLTDDDGPAVTVEFTTASHTVEEGESVTVTVTLNRDPEREVVIPITPVNLGDAMDADYSVPSNVTFTAGQTSATFTVSAAEDGTPDEADVSVRLDFGTLPDGVTAGSRASVTVTLTDDDAREIVLSTAGITFYETDENQTKTYTVGLGSEPTAAVTVDLTLSGFDHVTTLPVLSATSLTFTPSNWDTHQTVTVTALPDNDADIDTALVVHAASGGDYGSNAVSEVELVLITYDDETASTQVTLAMSHTTLSETAGATDIVATAAWDQGGSKTDTVLTLRLQRATGTEREDYTAPSSLMLTIAAQALTGTMTFELTPTDDDLWEPEEEILYLAGLNLTPRAVRASLELTSDDAEPVLSFTASEPEMSEAGGSVDLVAEITNGVGFEDEQTVVLDFVAGNATHGTDYTQSPSGSSLKLGAGVVSASSTVMLTAVQDSVDEEDEYVEVEASHDGTTIGTAQRITILDDDTRAVVPSKTGVTVPEGGNATYTIALGSEPTGSVTVTPGASGSTDVTVSGALTFTTSNWNLGQTVTVTAAEDADAEADTATVSHTVSGADYDSMTVASVSVTVTENEVVATAVDLSVDPEQVGEGAGGTSVVVTGTLNGTPLTTATTVTVSVSGDTASSGDFTAVADFMLTIRANAASGTATFTLAPVDDDVDEADETVTVGGTVSGLTVNTATLTINDDDTRAVEVSETEVTVPEGGTETYTITLGSEPTGSVTVTPGTSGNTDVTVSGELTFTTSNWDVGQTVTVTAAEDADAVTDTATVSHSVSGADYGSNSVTAASVSVTVAENEVASTAVNLSVDPGQVGEGAGGTSVVVTGTLNGTSRTTATTVTVSVSGDTASSGDFTAVSDFTLTIAANAASGTATFTLAPAADDVDEADETVTVDGTVSGLTVNTATLTIVDDDTRAVEVSATGVTVPEGGTETYTIELGSEPTGSVTVTPGTSGNADVTVSGALTFTTSNWDVGQTVTVTASEDADAEADTATVLHSVSGADYGSNSVTASSVSVTVTENEVASTEVDLSVDPDQVGEGAGGTSVVVTGTLDEAPRTTATVLTVSVSGDTASSGDFAAVSDFLLTIAANASSGTATFTLVPVDDAVDEEDETVTVDGAVSGLTVNAATLTIVDDDTRAVEVSATAVTVPEGGTETYTIELGSEPTGSVTVTPGTSGNTDVTVSGALTFTTSNWDVGQTVTVTAAEDADAVEDTATVSHSVSGADYGPVTVASVSVTVAENEVASTAVDLSVSPDQVEEDAGGTSVVATGTLNGATRTTATTVTVSVSGDTASSGDFTAVTDFTLTIAANAASGTATFTLAPVDDDVDETDETVTVGGTVSGLTVNAATLTIEDDDTRAVEVSETEVTVPEGGTETYTITLGSEPTGSVTVTPGTSGNADVTVSGALTFTASNWSVGQTVTVSAAEDADAVTDTATVTHAVSGADYGPVTMASVSVTVAENEVASTAVDLSVGPDQVGEGAGGTSVVVTGTLDEASRTVATVLAVSVSGDTASSGDFTAVPDFTLTITANATSGTATFTLAPVDDDVDEANETVTVSGTVSGLTVNAATLTIVDDDTRTVEVSATGVTVPEGGTETYTIVLGSQPTGSVTVTPGTSGNADVTVSGALTFTAFNWDVGQTVTVTAAEDADAVEDTATVSHAVSGADYGPVTVASVSVTVAENEVASTAVDLSVSPDQVEEDASGTSVVVTGTLNGATRTTATTVTVSVSGDTASSGDFAAVTDFTLTITASASSGTATFTLAPVDDAVDETDETVTVGGTVSGLTVNAATLTIVDDDTRAVEVSATAVTVPEGGTGTYTIELGSEPTGSVTVTPGTSGNADVTVSGALTFTTSNWNVGQTVTVTAAEDADAVTDTATVSHAVSGADYGPVTAASVTVTVTENEVESTAVDLSASPDQIEEDAGGTSVVVTGTLDEAPRLTATVLTVSVSGDTASSSDFTAVSDFLLTIAANATSGTATFTLAPVDDAVDETDETVTVDGTVSGLTVNAATLTIGDDDTRAVEVSATGVMVPEGGTETYTIELGSEPTGSVTVTPSASGSTDVTVSSALTFTTSNWNVGQTVTVTAAEDADAVTDTATVSHTVSGADYGPVTVASVSVTVAENEVESTVVDLSVSPDQIEEDAGGTSVVVTGTLDAAPRTTATVLTVSVSGDTASSGDFTAVPDFMLTITANASSGTATFTLAPVDDAVDEADETVTVDGTISGLTVNAATLTIEDDDTRAVEVSATAVTVPEGGTETYTIELGSEPTGSVTVTPGTSGNADVTVSGALTFTTSNWNVGQTVTVTAAEDEDAEVDTATVSHAVSGADYGSNSVTAASVSVTVAENEVASTAVNLSVDPDKVGEDASGTSVVVTGTLNGANRTTATTVTVSVSGDTASSGDFTAVSDFTLTIAANAASGTATFTLAPVDDAVDETDETVTVDGTVSGLTVNTATLTIEDDDTRAVEVSATAVTVPEGGTGTYTIELGSEPTGSVTVTPGTSGNADVTVSGALTFTTSNWNEGQTVTVTAAEDADAEADTAAVSHSVSGADYGPVTVASVSVTVTENDVASTEVDLSVNPLRIEEDAGGTSVVVTGTLDEASRTTATVLTVSVSGDTASSGDFAAVPDLTLTIAANAASGTATFTLAPVDDAVDEEDETVTVDGTISGLTVNAATLTIEDDDTRAVEVSATAVTVPEGGTETYTIELGSEPTGSVTVTPGTSGNADVTVSGALTFTTSNWSVGQTVMVTAAEDADAITDTATVSHAVSGADYGPVTVASVSVTVAENEVESTAVDLSVSPSRIEEDAGGTSVGVTGTLDGAIRTTAMTVTVSVSGDTASSGDFTAVTDFTLTIAANAASGTATFTLVPVDDDVDEADETVTVSGTISGLTVNAATLTIGDDDTRAVEVSATGVTVPEGGTETYTIALGSEPTGSVTVTPGTSGDADVTVSGALTFTTSNWDVGQTVTVSAAEDADAVTDTATVSHAVSGADYGPVTVASVSVTVTENETASTEVDLSVGPDQVGEGAGGTSVVVTGTLDEAPRTVATVLTVSVSGDTASSGDFTAVSDFTLTIAANATSGTATFTLAPVDDDVDETDETVTVDGTVLGLTVNAATLTIGDDDTRAVEVSVTGVPVPEGGTGTYTIALGSQPTGLVTVTPDVSGSANVTVSGALRFTTSNWAIEQTVTVTAAEDTDAIADTATVSHAVSGADYGPVAAASVSVTVAENEVASTVVDLSVDPDQVGEGAGGTSVVVTGMLNSGSRPAATVLTVSVSGDTASSGDFTAVTDFLLTIAAETLSGTATFTLAPEADDVDETDETVTVDGTISGLTVNAATLTIEDDDTRAVEVSETRVAVPEGGTGTYTVVLGSQPTGAVTVTPDASGDADVTVSGALTFTTSNWNVGQTVTVTAAQDADAVADTATVSHAVSGADYGSNGVTAASVSVRASDDETPSTAVNLSVDPDQAGEGAGGTSVVVTGTLDAAPRTTAMVLTVSVSGDTASSGDFTAVTDFMLTIAAETLSGTATFTLAPVDDAVDEPNETVTVGGTVSGLSVNAATVTIEDNDTRAVEVSATEVTVPEGGAGTYTIVLASQPTGRVRVIPGANGNTDVTVSGVLRFTASNWNVGQTVTVTAAEDADAVADTATVSHAVSGADYGPVTVASVSVTVEDNDSPSTKVTLSVGHATVVEGAGVQSVIVTGQLNGAPEAQDVAVTLSAGGGTAQAYTAPGAVLTITAGQTQAQVAFTVVPEDDAVDEGDETLVVSGTLSSSQALTVEPAAGLTVTIADDDERGVRVSPLTLIVEEGDEESYEVALGSEPTGAVTVTVSGYAAADLTVSTESLTFTASDWAVAQTVTVMAVDDTDVEADEVETLEHEVMGADYEQEVAPGVTVTVFGFEPTDEGNGAKLLVEPDGVVVVPTGTPAPAGMQLELPAGSAGATVEITTGETTGSDYELSGFRLGNTVVDISGVVLGPNETATVCLPSAGEEEVSLRHWDENAMAWLELANVRQETREGQALICGETEHFSMFATFVELEEPGLVLSAEALTVTSGEEEGAAYTVLLGAAPEGTVTVTVSGHEGTKLLVSPMTLEFTEDDWAVAQTVTVTASEESEATEPTESAGMEVLTHTAAGGRYRDQWSATVTVTVAVMQESELPQRAWEAWLARFGRTAAGHVAEAVAERVAAPAGQEMALTLDGAQPQESLVMGALQALAGEAAPDMGQMLGNGAFVLPLGPDGWTAWGRGAYTEFDGEEEGLKLDGEVRSGTFGMDVERGDWRWGLALSHSDGDGDIRETDGDHYALESSLTGAHPYARWQADEQFSVWGMLGYGEGELEQERDGQRTETDLEMRMAAFGLHGALGEVESGLGTFGLSLKSDVLAVQMETDADEELPEVEADASRVRVLLEGAGQSELESGGLVMPTLEAGLRWDEGDAETGLGAELGAGLHFADETGRLSAELSARTLLAHEESGYEEWGVGGSLRLEPDATGRGLSLAMESSVGATGSETDELWTRHDLSGLASEEGFKAGGRLRVEMGYGLNGPGGFGLLTPHAGYERTGRDATWRLGGHLKAGELNLEIESAWQRAGDGDDERRLKVGISGRW